MISGNIIKNIFIASDTVNPIGISAGTMTNSTISQNSVTGITGTSILPAGMAFSTASSGNTITQNLVDGVSTTSSTDPIGISVGTGFVNSTISRNTITNIFTTTTGGYGGRGFVINTGTATSGLTFSNNFIANIRGDGWSAFSSDSIAGVIITGTTGGLNFYYNSINLGSGSFAGNASGTLSAAFYVASTVTNLDLRDNIFVTNLVNTNAAAAKTYAIYSDAASSVFTTMNNNDYFVSGTQGVLGFIGATDRTTLAAIQAGFGQNGASQNGNPQFVSATDLHINPSVPTVVEGTATPITGITVDIDGDTRNATTPDMGADEGNFIAVVANDMQATAFVDPVNGGSKLANTAFSPQASFTNNGLNTQTNVTVRYRICSDGSCTTELYNNTQVIASIASGTTTTVTFASVAGGLPAGTYTIKAKSELGGDQVPANDEISGSFSVQSPLSGGYTVGSGGNYPTISAAVNALTNLGVSGPVVMTLTDPSYMHPELPSAETYPITIGAIPGASSTNTITIKPAAAGTTISGSNASAIFIFNSASWVTIDGSSNGTSSRDLTITNSNTSAAAVIWLKSNGTGLGSTNNTIKNVNIVGGSVTTTYGIALSGTTVGTAGADNDNNTLQNNSITTVLYGIYANGTAAVSTGGLDGLAITNNVIGPASSGATNTGFAGIWLANAISPTITGNTVRNLSSTAVSTGGIRLDNNVNGATVSQNTLNNITSSSTGNGTTSLTGIYLGSQVINSTVSQNSLTTIVSTTTSGYGSRGIMVNSGVAASNDTIVNNLITDVYCFQDASNIYWPIGIALEGVSGGIKIYDNSVNLFGSHPGYASNTTGGAAPAMFNNSTGTSIDIRDNVFTSSYENTTSTGDKAYAIYSVAAASAYSNINYNDYFASGPGIPVLGFLGSDQPTIAAWRIATAQDAQSLSADPLYVSATNLHIATSGPVSPLARVGQTIAGVTTDFDGDTRKPTPDIGADEFATYLVSSTADPNGMIAPLLTNAIYNSGSSQLFTITPTTGYHIADVTDNNVSQGPVPTYNLANITSDHTIAATFAINTYTLTYTAGPNGSISGTSPQTVNYGGSGTPVTAVPDTGYHFVNWSDGSTDNPRTDTNVMMDISVTANFAINTYTLTYTAGPHGSISGMSPQTVNYGGSGTPVTAVPDTGYHFVNWSDGSTDNPRTDTNVMMDISVTANFAINTYTLTYMAGPHGSISGMSPQTVPYGGSGSPVTAVPDTGYHFVNWSDGSTDNPRTDTNVMMDISVTANFGPNPNVTVSGSTGADGNYATLADAFTALNANTTQTGNAILVTIVSDTTEPAAGASLNNPTGGNWASLTIRPNGARSVTGAVTAGSPLIDLNGARNVTIDGLNSGGNSLTISNTTASSTAGTSTIRLINGAQNDLVTNCNIRGSSISSTGTAGGNVLISTSTGGANSGNTISNNDLGPAGVNLPNKCVMSLGSASPNNNTGNVIDNNNIFDFFTPAVTCAGISISTNTDLTTISNNRIYQTAPRTFTTTGLRYNGVLVSPGSAGSATISGNRIGFGAADGTGTTTISGLANTVNGIQAPSTSTTVATSIQNNTISGFNQTTSTGTTGSGTSFIGISVGATAGLFNIGGVTGNTVGSLDNSSSIVVNDTTVTNNTWGFCGIFDFSFQNGDIISNNRIGTITINSGGSGTGAGFRGIRNAQTTGVNTTINNNIIGGTATGSITDNVVGTYNMYGIDNASADLTCVGNVVRNISGNANAAGFISISGIIVSVAPTGVSTISQNMIYSLSDNSTPNNGAIYALYGNFPATANVVERNFVHSLSITSTNTGAQLAGIIAVAGSGTYQNNMVQLGVDATGASITNGYVMYGMFDIAGTNNFYYNSVYIGGSNVASVSNTFAFVSNVATGTRNYIDNIFDNSRSNASGAGKNYAITLAATAGATSNYNDLYANGVGGFVGVFSGVDQATLADWQAATGLDANSISGDPLLLAPNGTALTADLHIACGSAAISRGAPVAGITTDFDNDTRSATTPTIGADELILNAPTAVSAVSRKTHGAAGDFDIDLPFSGPIGIESRSGGGTGDYRVVVTFATPVTVGSAMVSSGIGTVVTASGNGTNTITIDLTGVADVQYITITLGCVDDGTNLGDVPVTMGVLVGNVNANGCINAADVAAAKAQLGVPIGPGNFRADVNANGTMSAADVAIVKSNSGACLP